VSLDRSAETRFKSLGLTPIFTDAAYFVEVLKKHLQTDKHSLSDDRLAAVPLALARANTEHARLHEAFKIAAGPEVVYAACYQDGLIHALERITSRLHAGDDSHQCEMAARVQKYPSIRAENLRARRYLDVAYIEGYINGLLYLLFDDAAPAHIPYYFVFGLRDQSANLAQYKKALRSLPRPHKAANALAGRLVREKLGSGDELRHTPFLTWKAESEAPNQI
jgi:hypothetical protein